MELRPSTVARGNRGGSSKSFDDKSLGGKLQDASRRLAAKYGSEEEGVKEAVFQDMLKC